MTEHARVARVLAAAGRVADRSDILGEEARALLPVFASLSPEGVELALGTHMERDAPPENIAALVHSVGRSPACHVVISANVCTAAVRAIALAVATSPRVFVRPSRRDPVVADLLVRALQEDSAFAAAGGEIALTEELDPHAGDEVHVYGADSTIDAFREALGPDIRLRSHGTGVGIAVVGPGGDPAVIANDLAADVVPFDQAGCLSPRLVLVFGTAEEAKALFVECQKAMVAWGERVPRGRVSADLEAAIVRYVSLASSLGACERLAHATVGLDLNPESLPLAPVGRTLHLARMPADLERARDLLMLWRPFVTCVGLAGETSGLDEWLSMFEPVRRCALGQMQRPPFDGPVDRRVR